MFDSIPSTNLSGKFLKLWKYFFDEILMTVFVTKLFIYSLMSNVMIVIQFISDSLFPLTQLLHCVKTKNRFWVMTTVCLRLRVTAKVFGRVESHKKLNATRIQVQGQRSD